MAEIVGVGGYSEGGKNMVAVKINSDAAIFDMGFNVQKIVDFEEEGGVRDDLNMGQLIKLNAIPDDNAISSWKNIVRAIALSHCHFDHIGAAPYLEKNYSAPVYGTAYTMAVLRHMIRDDNLSMKNTMHEVPFRKMIKLSKDMSLELVHVTHSTPQTSFVALHTKHGVIIYAPDFKFDDTPIIGERPDYERIRELRDEGVLALFVDSLYAKHNDKTPSEKTAREMLREVLFNTENRDNAIVGTCFASHIARLKSFVEFGNKLGRKVVILGRSMMKYCDAAKEVGIADFSRQAEIVGYGREVKRKLREIEKQGPGNYLIVCTGGQGEKNSVLSRMMREDYPFRFMSEDHVIFSNRIIPVEPNITNREEVERRLREFGVQVFDDVHVSGHGRRKDIEEFITMADPRHVIPAHGPSSVVNGTVELAKSMGYKPGRDLHVLENGKKVRID